MPPMSPLGNFNLAGKVVPVSDPNDQRILGNVTSAWGFEVTYHPTAQYQRATLSSS